jgi:SAM-dependent methyltransferase
MGLIGGKPAYSFLKRFYPGGQNLPMSDGNPYAARGQSKLSVLLGPKIFEELAGKIVLDYGCGEGETCIELAERGVARSIGLDIQDALLARARERAERRGVADKCSFVSSVQEKVDVVLSMDAFEHFDDPAAVLREMAALLRPGGYAVIEFGPTWFHPLGGHLFSVFPWAHLLFTEKALIRWRSDFKSDGATRFNEVAGGLNRMTIARWERLVSESPLKFLTSELVAIRRLRPLHNRLTREFFTAIVRARLGLRDTREHGI